MAIKDFGRRSRSGNISSAFYGDFFLILHFFSAIPKII
jgi:hypothetical protein